MNCPLCNVRLIQHECHDQYGFTHNELEHPASDGCVLAVIHRQSVRIWEAISVAISQALSREVKP